MNKELKDKEKGREQDEQVKQMERQCQSLYGGILILGKFLYETMQEVHMSYLHEEKYVQIFKMKKYE